MASVFRHSYTSKDPETGKRITKRTRKWYVSYVDADGIRRKVPGFADKEATRQLAADLERRAARARTGLIDREEPHRRRPLLDHLSDYEADLRGKGRSEKHVQDTATRIRDVFTGCSFAFLPDVEPERITAHLAHLRDVGKPRKRQTEESEQANEDEKKAKKPPLPPIPLSIASCNHHVRALKMFGNWLVKASRTKSNPFASLTTMNAETDRKRRRRALSADDFGKLLRTTASGPDFRGLSGHARELLYRLAASTGFRVRELASLTPASFDFEGETPTVTVAAAYAKNRREDTLPLRADLVPSLKPFVGVKPSGSPVWPTTWHQRAAKMLRNDVERAGLSYVDESDRVFDFHALRGQAATDLARAGVPLATTQKIMRHSTPTLTAKHYTHLRTEDMADAIARVPSPKSDDGSTEAEPVAERDTGTDASPALGYPLGYADGVSCHSVSAGDREVRDADAPSGQTESLQTTGKNTAAARDEEGEKLVPLLGIEPRTRGLRIRCSAS